MHVYATPSVNITLCACVLIHMGSFQHTRLFLPTPHVLYTVVWLGGGARGWVVGWLVGALWERRPLAARGGRRRTTQPRTHHPTTHAPPNHARTTQPRTHHPTTLHPTTPPCIKLNKQMNYETLYSKTIAQYCEIFTGYKQWGRTPSIHLTWSRFSHSTLT